MTTLWRMETNGVARDRMFAINFTDPLARTDDTKPEPNKSSTEDNRRELAEAVKALKRRTGASKVALVANSRGGYSVRNFIKNGGAADVSHAVLCGVPNHGVYDWDQGLGNEFNGRGPFLRGLNEGDSEVTPGVAFLTLRSDGMDKYAQADGRFVGKPGTPTGITSGRSGAEGRDQSRDRRGRSPRDGLFTARVCRDVQIHRRPRTAIHRGRAGDGSQTERARHRHARRRSDQPSGGRRVGRSLSRVARNRRTHRRAIHSSKTARTGAGVRRRSIHPGISRSC